MEEKEITAAIAGMPVMMLGRDIDCLQSVIASLEHARQNMGPTCMEAYMGKTPEGESFNDRFYKSGVAKMARSIESRGKDPDTRKTIESYRELGDSFVPGMDSEEYYKKLQESIDFAQGTLTALMKEIKELQEMELKYFNVEPEYGFRAVKKFEEVLFPKNPLKGMFKGLLNRDGEDNDDDGDEGMPGFGSY